MKNDILTDLKQGLHDYEKLKEGNSKIGKVEALITFSVGTIVSSFLYYYLTKDMSLRQPTEEEINYIISRSGKETPTFPGWGNGPGAVPSGKYPIIETREEAIGYFMTDQIFQMNYLRYLGYPLSIFLFITVPLLAFNPGEKILKSSYTLGKTVRDGFGTIKSYLKGMQELKRKRKEVISYER